VKNLILLILAAVAASLPSHADVIRKWDFNSITADSVVQTGTRRPTDGVSAIARAVGGVGNRFGVVSTINQPADPNTFDNSHWRIGQTENPQTGLADPATGFPAATSGNKTAGVLFPVNTSGYSNIRVTWSQENSASASRYWRIQYTVNGLDWLDTSTVITALSIDNNGAESGTPVWQHGLSADFSGLPGVDNNPNFAFRIVSEFESTATGAGADAYVANRVSAAYGRTGTMWLDLVDVTGDSIAPNNQWPVLSAIPDQVILTNESSLELAFTVSDLETPAGNLVMAASSSDPALISTVDLGGAAGSRTVTVTPQPGQQGSAVITISARDEGNKVAETSFEVSVTVPSIFPIAGQTTTSDAAVVVSFVTTNLPGDPWFDWTLTAGSSNPGVVANSGIAFGERNGTATNTVTITPVAGSMGSTIITITNTGLRGWTAVQSFEVKVLPPIIVFFNLTGLPSTGGVPSVDATTVSNGLTAGPLIRGPGIVQAGLGNGFSANNWNNTKSTTHPVAANRTTAISEGEYFEFSVTVQPGYKLSLASIETSLRRSAVASPMNFEWQYSLDDFATPGIPMVNFNYFGRDSGTAPANLLPYQWMTTDTPGQANGNPTPPLLVDTIPALQDVPAGAKITFRLYAWGAGNGADSNTLALGRFNGPGLRGIIQPVSDAPAITIRRSGSDIILSWPTSALDYELQRASTLTGDLWQPSALSRTVDGDNFVVTITNPSGTEFFRLAK
jgi:hypothetical protein